ncbi:unnamed protein product, partial [Prorocentrum cordatum]
YCWWRWAGSPQRRCTAHSTVTSGGCTTGTTSSARSAGYDPQGFCVRHEVGSQVSKPMLYWCRDASGAAGAGLDLAHPVCRERCPTGPGTDAACFSGAREGPKVIIDDLNSYTVQRTYTFQTVPDYNSSAFMGIACLPEDRALRMQVASQFQDGIASRVWLWVVSVRNAWPLILVAAAVATGLGFLNIAVLQRLAGPAVYCAAGVLCAAPLALGGGLLHGGLGGPGGGEADLLAG